VAEPEDAIEKAKHQKDSIKAQRIIADSNQRPPDPVCIIQENSERDV
jgi:hypothetical protein